MKPLPEEPKGNCDISIFEQQKKQFIYDSIKVLHENQLKLESLIKKMPFQTVSIQCTNNGCGCWNYFKWWEEEKKCNECGAPL